jgi:hypothetical protein
LLFTVILIAVLPWAVKPTVEYFRKTMQAAATRLGLASYWDVFWTQAANADQGSSAFVGSVFQYIGSLLPGYAKPWAEALIDRPIACGIVVALAVILYFRNGTLRDRIADLARQAWLPSEQNGCHQEKESQGSDPQHARNEDSAVEARRTPGMRGQPLRAAICGIVLIYVAIGVSISRSTVTLRDGSGAICAEEEGASANRPGAVMLQPGQTLIRDGFETSRRFWASSVALKEGQHYTMWIEMTDPPFFDRTIMTDIAGFKDASLIHLLAWPIRRWRTGSNPLPGSAEPVSTHGR